MASPSLRFQNDRSGAVNAVQVILAPRRSTIAVRRIEPSSPQFVLEERTLQIYFDRSLEPGETVSLELGFRGIEPRPLAPDFHHATDAEWRKHGDVSQLHFKRKEPSKEEMLEWREKRAKAGPFTEFKRFFNSFDDLTWSTDPDFVLQDKLLAMLRARRRGADDEVRRMRAKITAAELAPVSTALKRSLTPLPLHKDTLPLHDAFDRFSRGELSMLKGGEPREEVADYMGLACQPDSTLYFLFAELADACVEHKVDVKLWENLRPTLVYTQATFYEAYSDGSLKPLLHGAEFDGLRPPEDPVPEARLRSQREQVLASCELDVLWRSNLRSFIRF